MRPHLSRRAAARRIRHLPRCGELRSARQAALPHSARARHAHPARIICANRAGPSGSSRAAPLRQATHRDPAARMPTGTSGPRTARSRALPTVHILPSCNPMRKSI